MDKFLKWKHDSGTDNASTNTSNINDDTFNNENKIKKVNRLYCNGYLNVGFSYVYENYCQIPLCVVYGKKLSNSAIEPAKLKRHSSSKYVNHQSKKKNYFERLLNINTSSYEFTLEEEEEFITLITDWTIKITFSEITVEELKTWGQQQDISIFWPKSVFDCTLSRKKNCVV
jgi:hypothetical protein